MLNRDVIYIVGIVMLLGLVSGAWFSYRAVLIDKGRQECQAQVQRAISQQQAIANENASVYEAGEQKARIEYRTRIKEVVKHVPINHGCDLSDDAVRMLNDAISASHPLAR